MSTFTPGILPTYSGASLSREVQECNIHFMRRSLGFLVLLWGVSHFFSSSFQAFDAAARESLKLVEASAIISQEKIQEQR